MSGGNYYYSYAGGNPSHPSDPSGNSTNGDYASHTTSHSQHGMYYNDGAVNGWPQDAMMQPQQQQAQQQQPQTLPHAYMPLNGASASAYDPTVAVAYDYPNMYYHDNPTGMVTVPMAAGNAAENPAAMTQHGYGNGGASYNTHTQHQPHPSAGLDWNTNPGSTAAPHVAAAETGVGATSSVDPFDVFDYGKSSGTTAAGNNNAATTTAAADDAWIYQLADITPPNQAPEPEQQSQASLKSKSSRSLSSSYSQSKPKKRRRGAASTSKHDVIESAPSPLSVFSNPPPPTSPQSTSNVDPILANFSMTISSLSETPLSGVDVVNRVQEKAREVQTRYLPCVEFLVLCQQELRQGISLAMQVPKSSRGYWVSVTCLDI